MTNETKTLALDGPFLVQARVFGTTAKGELATLTYEFPAGKIPTVEEFQTAVDQSLLRLQKADVEGGRLFTRHEFVRRLVEESLGTLAGSIHFDVEGPDHFTLDQAAGTA
jgi:hypothetical protein